MSIFSKTEPVDAADRDRLEQLCSVVSLGLKQFQRVGLALEEIRETQLYKLSHKTFGEFCLSRWKMSETHAVRLVAAAELCRQLGEDAHVVSNERQARELRQLPEDIRVDVIAAAKADKTDVGPALRKLRPAGRKGIRPIRLRLPGATVVIEPNKKFHGLEQTLLFALEKLRSEKAA